MSSVGQQIREQRLRLGLTLEEIAARSRIPLRTLQAIESDDVDRISSPFLYKSFTRQFAEHLRLDYQQLAPAIEAVALGMPQPRVPGDGNSGKTNLAPLPVKGRSKSYRWLYSVASLGFMLVACSSFYGVWQKSKFTWLAELGAITHSANLPAGSKLPAPTALSVLASPSTSHVALTTRHPRRLPPAIPKAANPEESLAAADPDPAPSSDQQSLDYRVELSAIERTWVSIVEDGKQTFSGVLDPDQTKVLEGHETASVRTGNAGGISCVFNGKSIGPIGPRGQVRIVVFTKSNYEVLDAAAHIALTHFPSIVE